MATNGVHSGATFKTQGAKTCQTDKGDDKAAISGPFVYLVII